MKKLSLISILFALSISLCLTGVSSGAETGTCYNCPPEWADWGTQLKAIKENLALMSPTTIRIPGRPYPSSSLRRITRLPMSLISE